MERLAVRDVNLVVEKHDTEVRVWICDAEGKNVFRLKAIGKVHAATIDDIVVVGKNVKLKNIPTDKIDMNPDNPRIIFRSEELESLLLSISQIGIQVPITVYKEEDRYVLIDGERRWKCAKKLNFKTIPALIQEKPTRLQNLLLMFNIHSLREQWDILTIAMKLPLIIDLLCREKGAKPSERELAKYTGLSQGTIRRSKLLMGLPEQYKETILQELKKPKSKQKLTEDFFIEMERSLKTVKRYLPGVVRDLNRVRETLIEKYQNGTISNILHFRDVSRIARAEKLGVPRDRAHHVLERLFEDNNYSVEYAFRDSVEWAYDERNFLNKVEWLLENLQSHANEIADSEPLKEMLLRLKRWIVKVQRNVWKERRRAEKQREKQEDERKQKNLMERFIWSDKR